MWEWREKCKIQGNKNQYKTNSMWDVESLKEVSQLGFKKGEKDRIG